MSIRFPNIDIGPGGRSYLTSGLVDSNGVEKCNIVMIDGLKYMVRAIEHDQSVSGDVYLRDRLQLAMNSAKERV